MSAELASVLQTDGAQAWVDNEAAEAEWRFERRTRRRLRRTYGDDGLRLIAGLVERALAARHSMPIEEAWAWAEAKYERGEVLC